MKKCKLLGGVWNCSACTYENHDLLNSCEMCETAKPPIKLPDKLPIKLPDKLPIKLPDKLPDKLTTFYVYTTGIADWGKIETIANKWNDYILENILQQIPPNYKEIKILHCDPLLETQDTTKRMEIAIKFNDFLNKPLGYIYSKYKKMFSIKFIPDKLNIAQIKSPHIIIDCGHVFRYDKMVGHVSIGNHYGDINANLIKLNAIYLGYFGGNTDTDKMFMLLARSPNLFKVNEKGEVITFIDKMIENKYAYDEDYPNGIIIDIINKHIKTYAFAQFRKAFGKVNDYADKLVENIIISDKYVKNVIELIANDISQKDSIKILCDIFDSDLQIKLTNEKVIENLTK